MFDAPLVEGPEEVDYMTLSENTLKPGPYVLVNVKGGYRQSISYNVSYNLYTMLIMHFMMMMLTMMKVKQFSK